MSQSIELNSFTRLALVIIAVALVVAVIHIVSGSARFEKRAGALTAVCAVILCAGFAALAMLSRGRPDAIELEGFERFASDDTAAAAELTERRSRASISTPATPWERSSRGSSSTARTASLPG